MRQPVASAICVRHAATVAVLLSASGALAQASDANASDTARRGVAGYVTPAHRLIEPGPVETVRLHADGREVEVETATEWRLICGSDARVVDAERFASIVETSKAALEDVVPSATSRGSGLDIVFNTDGSVPAAALNALVTVESIIESTFGDNMTVTVDLSFANLGGGVLGATGSSTLNTSYTNVRLGLQNGQDADDTIQASLPAGSTLPTRLNGGSSAVSSIGTLTATRANFVSTIGAAPGSAGSIVINSSTLWDYNPANGIGFSSWSFVDVMIHEVGHAMGFTSGVDGGNVRILDVFRFQRTDGAGDFNPDTLAEFGTTARLFDFGTPNDAHNADLISVEHRMADGSPNQASHLREQSPSLGLMDPVLGNGQSEFPNYFSTADLDLFDAIGWDFPIVESTGACCFADGTCSDGTADACSGAGGLYQGDATDCATAMCAAGQIELRIVESDGEGLDANNLSTGPVMVEGAGSVTMYVQARIMNDPDATGLVTFDGALVDSDGSGSFAAVLLTNTEAIGSPIPGDDFQGRTGMFPNYRATIGPNNADLGNGNPIGGEWLFLPLNIVPTGNGQGLNGNWTNTYKVAWTTADATARTVTLTVDALFGGYQSTNGLVEPVPIVNDTFEITIGSSCPCERTGNMTVDVLDLLDFLSVWFTDSGAPPPGGAGTGADFNADNTVDVLDLLEFLSCWFPACP